MRINHFRISWTTPQPPATRRVSASRSLGSTVTWARAITTSPTDVTWDRSLLPRLSWTPNWTLTIYHSRNTVFWRLLRSFGWVRKKVQIATTRIGKKNIVPSIFPLLVPSHSTFGTSSPKKKSQQIKNFSLPLWRQTITFQTGVQLSHITFLFFLTIKSLPKLEPNNTDVFGAREDKGV